MNSTVAEPATDQMIVSDERVTERYRNVSTAQIEAWVEQFHRDGYLFLEEVLNAPLIAQLKQDLEDVLGPRQPDETNMKLKVCMFETSPANVSLFDLEPIVTFAEALVSNSCHVIHNNSFRTYPGGGLSGWHQDDAPHYLVTEGEAPTNVRLPVLLFTANYYLTDVEAPEFGGTEVIPRSHLFGKPCPPKLEGTEFESLIHPCVGKAGSVAMFNNQVWHRGGPNRTERTRYITQVSYARRIIGHKYFPFMNYVMPEHVYRDADPRLKRLLGFLPSGAYG